MRTIDGDALKERIDFCTTKGMGSTLAFTFKHMIDEAPTIEPELYSLTVTNTLSEEEFKKALEKANEEAIILVAEPERKRRRREETAMSDIRLDIEYARQYRYER